jgi:xylose isomerase
MEDIFIAHIGGMDTFARALEIAHRLLEDSPLANARKDRYRSYDAGDGARFERGELDLTALRDIAAAGGEPRQASAKQEWFENLINQYIE